MMQGDSYGIPFEIRVDGVIASDSDFEDVEISIGNITKSISSGGVSFDGTKNAFVFSVSQEETFALASVKQRVQIRVKRLNGYVHGVALDGFDVVGAISKAVL